MALKPEKKVKDSLSINEILCGEVINIIDVGASSHGAYTEPYAPIMKAGVARVVGFEPDAEAYNTLCTLYADNPDYRYYPYFIGKGGSATFYKTNWYMTGSLYKPNKTLLDSFYQLGEITDCIAEQSIQTVRLDDIDDLGDVDMIKIDVQGAELDVFEGGKTVVSKALVVWIEVEFVELYEGQPLFADVDKFMREQGYIFHCFTGIASRNFKPLYVKDNPYAGGRQALWSDAIYIKNFQKFCYLDTKKLRKLAVILDSVVHSSDLALLALREIDRKEGTHLAEIYFNTLSNQIALDQSKQSEQSDEINKKTLRALALQEQNQIVEATNLFKEILVVAPAHFPSLYSLSVILSKNEDYSEALLLIEKAIEAISTYAPAFFVKAVILQALKHYNEALVSYQQALVLDPQYLDAMNNRGNLLYEMKQYDLAFASFSEILKIDANSDKALSNSGIILTLQNKDEQAIEFFDRLLKSNPDFDYARGLLFYSQLHCCDWSDYAKHNDLISQGIQAGKRTCKTLALMAFSNSASDSLKCAQIFAKHFFPAKSKVLWNGECYQHDRIRVAYISPDFRQHPVGHLMAGVIENHNKSRIETIGISIGIDDSSTLRSRFIAAFSQFYDVQTKTSFEIAQLIRNLEVDILVDLAGYTADSRTDILSYRPAPIQVNYLGYPGTMGLDYIDYILADPHVIPEEHQQFYTEKVAYMLNTYLPTDGSLQISEHTPTREEMNLPPTGVVFCSFNHDYKINPPIFSVWMRILKQVPESVLWLMKLNEAAEKNLKKEAEQRGVNPDRLIFATRIPLIEDHLARYRLADLFLDTSPYNAHTTASDALFVGLPVLTYMGETFSGRVAGSLLKAIGLPELITNSLEDYEALAVKLALDTQLLGDIKAKLKSNKITYPLFNTKLFAENLENVFIKITKNTLPIRLHIGGKEKKAGWKILNIQPSQDVDYIGSITDLSKFPDESVIEIYASHVVAHVSYSKELMETLKGLWRILKNGGRLMLSVPDLEILSHLFVSSDLNINQKFHVMRMIFGGQTDQHDFHKTGFSFEILSSFLSQAGFEEIRRVENFGLFQDTSTYAPYGMSISLNVEARKL